MTLAHCHILSIKTKSWNQSSSVNAIQPMNFMRKLFNMKEHVSSSNNTIPHALTIQMPGFKLSYDES